MLDYGRHRAREVLGSVSTAVLATAGPAGVQAGVFPCELALEADSLALLILVPKTSDLLYNIEHEPAVTVLTTAWELRGTAWIECAEGARDRPALWKGLGAAWSALVRVRPWTLQIRRKDGWGNLETIDFQGSP
jgi:hypothetical protein